MRRWAGLLTAAAVAAAVAITLAVDVSGLLTGMQLAAEDALAADPPVSENLVVVGIQSPGRLISAEAQRRILAGLGVSTTAGGECAPLAEAAARLAAGNGTGGGATGVAGRVDSPLIDENGQLTLAFDAAIIRAVSRGEPSMIALTSVPLLNDVVTVDDAILLYEICRARRVVVPLVDARPTSEEATEGELAAIQPDLRLPSRLSVQRDIPDAHVIVPTTSESNVRRELPLLFEFEDRTFLPVGVAAVAAGSGISADQVEAATVRDGVVRLGPARIPTTDRNTLRINYSSTLVDDVPGTRTGRDVAPGIPYVDAVDILLQRVPASRFEDKLVIIGSVDPFDADYVPVPNGPVNGVPELWVHANAANTVLETAYLVDTPRWERAAWVVGVAVAAGLAMALLPLPSGTILALVASVLPIVVGGLRLQDGDVMDMVHPALAGLLSAGGVFVVRYLTEVRQRRRVASLFASYVPETVARQLMQEEQALARATDGERVEVTVLFCDLRGFTRHAGMLEPHDVRDLLNVYYRHTARIILDRAGTVMQYVGDEVFAVFGAPLPQADHAERALDAALAIQEAATAIADELAGSGIDPVAYGIGLHSGTVVAAHVGDAVRRQYSVVGDTVNVGARLCSQAKAGEIVVSEDLVARIDRELDLDPVGDVQLKGVEREFGIYRLQASGSSTQVPEGYP